MEINEKKHNFAQSETKKYLSDNRVSTSANVPKFPEIPTGSNLLSENMMV
jgi:hypothetical protein